MNVGDLVKLKDAIVGVRIGVIVEGLYGFPKTGFKVLFSDGKIKPALRQNLEVINESR